MRSRLVPALVAAAMLTLAVAAPPALADTSDSANWAGYAVHRLGLSFRRLSATWRQPTATCTVGNPRFSAVWVGLGGYSETSNALEQIGTEVDCGSAGKAVSSAWYELVPAPAQPIALRVRPGDALAASVTVNGHQVVVTLANETLHRNFTKTLHARTLDVSSAEWIVEAPSSCIGVGSCEMLPLADFGSVTFGHAVAESATGHFGSIGDRAWNWTRIRLRPGAQRFVANRGAVGSPGAATPSALSANGTSFNVTYSSVSARGAPIVSPGALQARYLVHPGR